MKTTRRRMDVNLDELDQVLDGARQGPLSESDHSNSKKHCMLWRRCWCNRGVRRRPERWWISRKTFKLGRSRITTRRHVDMAARERKHLAVRGVRAGLAHARQDGKRLGRPLTAGLHAEQVRKLHRSRPQ